MVFGNIEIKKRNHPYFSPENGSKVAECSAKPNVPKPRITCSDVFSTEEFTTSRGFGTPRLTARHSTTCDSHFIMAFYGNTQNTFPLTKAVFLKNGFP